ncbi:hypothetical protein HNP84_001602 [Thermocatellispora tengchongensis]|uniref:Uncharacterized protein n=1 Tax=Thermocatellispora tengchongensis TaxID=1073253 RepID=A0A840NYP5_9ACTN|nr:hypothetical protein [Thermocatellispora tengchongensis]MBB5131889.1 hypothetical protein [Thermocatellispora tengchongensis]
MDRRYDEDGRDVDLLRGRDDPRHDVRNDVRHDEDKEQRDELVVPRPREDASDASGAPDAPHARDSRDTRDTQGTTDTPAVPGEHVAPLPGPGPVYGGPEAAEDAAKRDEEHVSLPEDTPGEVRHELGEDAGGHAPADPTTGRDTTAPDDTTAPGDTADEAQAREREAAAVHDEAVHEAPADTPGTAPDAPGTATGAGAHAPGSEAWNLFGRDAEEILRRWHEVQVAFVDDPRAAVERADGLLDEMVSELTANLNERAQRLQDRWKGGDRADTEQLRLTLREYRSVLERLLEFSQFGRR